MFIYTYASAPSSLIYANLVSSYTVGTPIATNTWGCEGGDPTSFSINPSLPAGLSLGPTSGFISGTPTIETLQATYRVTASNSDGSTTVDLVITVLAQPPTILTYSLIDAVYTKNVAISANIPTNSGGVITSYIIDSSLPTGLSLNTSSGQISGTPTVLTSSTVTPRKNTYTIRGINSGGEISVVIYITVNDSPPTGLSYQYLTPVYTRGTAITANDVIGLTGGAVVSWTRTLPTGLSLSTSSSNLGQIYGTPQAVSSATRYTITATNTGGSSSIDLTITVNDKAPLNVAYGTYVLTISTAITAITPGYSADGGVPILFAISSGSLPSGLSLSSTTGVISGTPSALTSSQLTVVFDVSNTGGSTTATAYFTVNQIPPSNVRYSYPTPTYSVGTAITTNSILNDGGPISSFTVDPALPPGLVKFCVFCVIQHHFVLLDRLWTP